MQTKLLDYSRIDLFKSNPFFIDYVEGKNTSLYSHGFNHDEIAEIKTVNTITKEIAGNILSYNNSILKDETTTKSVDLLLKKDSAVIVTGQQPHIGGGPMYTLYKVITALLLAKKLKEIKGKEYVAVFWNGSDDHDIDEVNKLEFPSLDYGLYKSRLNLEYSAEPIYGYDTKSAFLPLIEDATSNLRQTEFTPLVKELLSANTDNLGLHVSHLYKKLFYGKGLVVIEPKILRKHSSEIYERLIEKEEEINKSVKSIGNKNTEFITKDGLSNLYYHGSKIREKIAIEKGSYVFSDKSLTKDEFKKFVSANPLDFSPGVVFRPLIQDYFFPTACYVGGPGECSYFSQLKDAYSIAEINMPAVMPRLSATIIKTSENKIIDKYGFDIEDVINSKISLPEDDEDMMAKAEIEAFIESINTKLDDFRKNAEKRSKELLEHLNPSFRKIDSELSKAGEKYIKTCQRIRGVKSGHIERLNFEVTPNRSLQERIFSPLFYINLYGTDFIDKIMENAKTDVFKHHVFYF